MTSGIVKTLRIGQFAGLLPKPVLIGYGRVSTTERVLVTNDGLINQRLLKIQSNPPRKGDDYVVMFNTNIVKYR